MKKTFDKIEKLADEFSFLDQDLILDLMYLGVTGNVAYNIGMKFADRIRELNTQEVDVIHKVDNPGQNLYSVVVLDPEDQSITASYAYYADNIIECEQTFAEDTFNVYSDDIVYFRLVLEG